MSEWEIDRHAVAICGHVTDAQTGKAIAGARVEIAAAPAAFIDWLAIQARQHGKGWAALSERPDRTRAKADGHFHFMDLPDGQYTLAVSLPGSGSRYGQAQVDATVSRDAEGNIVMVTANVSLSSTTLEGQVTSQTTGDPVVLAEIRMKDSGERAFSDREGQYLLAGLEVGSRTVQVSAQGHALLSRTVSLGEPGAVQTLDFALLPALPAGFNPTQVAGCQLWLSAEAITGLSDNAPLSTWPDGSSNGADATQSSAAARPVFKVNVLNGRPVVRFDGADDFMSLPLSASSTNHTFFFVVVLEALGGHNNFLFDAQSGRLALDGADRNAPHNIRWRDSTWRSVAAAVTGPQILTWVFSGATGQVFRDGTSLGTATYQPTALGGATALGANYNGTQNRFEGDIAEVIYYDRTLSTPDQQRVEQYLSERYAIALG